VALHDFDVVQGLSKLRSCLPGNVKHVGTMQQTRSLLDNETMKQSHCLSEYLRHFKHSTEQSVPSPTTLHRKKSRIVHLTSAQRGLSLQQIFLNRVQRQGSWSINFCDRSSGHETTRNPPPQSRRILDPASRLYIHPSNALLHELCLA